MGRVATSLAGVMGAAALVAVPISISAAAPPAASLVAATPAPGQTVPGDSQYNKESYWVGYLEDRGYENVVCIKDESPDDPYVVPALTDPDRVYVLAVVKGGSGDDANELYWDPEAGDVLNHSSAGISHVILCTAEEEETSTPTPTVTTTSPTPTPTVTTTSPTPTPTVTTTSPTPTPTVTTTSPTPTHTTTTPVPTHTTPVPTKTGPPVETDRPVTGSAAGLLGAATLVAAGIAAMVFARRRQGDHR